MEGVLVRRVVRRVRVVEVRVRGGRGDIGDRTNTFALWMESREIRHIRYYIL